MPKQEEIQFCVKNKNKHYLGWKLAEICKSDYS